MASQRRRLAEAPGTEPSSTIVIVDDDRDKRAALRAMLAPLGQRIVEAHSGQAALRAVADPAAATILFDVRMAQELHSSIESVATLSAALRDSELRTKALLDNVADGIFILDETGSIQLANRAASRLFGYRTEDLVGKPITLMLAPQCEADVSLLALVGPELARTPGAPAQTIETLGRRRDGSSFAMEIVCAMIRRGGRHLKLLCIRDVSERIAHTAALQQQASHDALTGLANRSLFSEYVARALADADTAGVEQQRAVLMVAFDGFKEVNDTLGHDRGDVLLRKLAAGLIVTLGDADAVARLGGTEFGVLSGESCDLARASALARSIHGMCEPGFLIDDELVRVRPSVGIALIPEHGRTTEELLRRADLAMYTAKRAGDPHAVYDAAQDRLKTERLALQLDLRHCVAQEELVLHYQPKIDLASGQIYGVEALIRWRHPRLGLLQPGSFMPDVERSELIAPVTRWVLDTALRQQHLWREEGIDLSVAVNVSARSLRSAGDLPEVVAELTDAWGTPAEWLTLELTESALIEAAAPAVLARLHAMGERLSIDDFGTGYSSLTYLQRLPLDELKVDRSFVTGLASGGDDAIIVRSTIDLAHNLGLRVVAEGVEHQHVMATLKEYGCDAAQGYLFSRPVPAAEINAQLAGAPPASAH